METTYLTVKETAARLGIRTSTVRRAIQTGRLIGNVEYGRICMTLEDVEAFRLRHRPNEGNVPARTQTRASLKSAVAPIPPQDWHNGLDWDDTPLEELRKLPQNFSESYHTVLYGRVTDHHFEQAGFRALLRD